jgi:1,4-dihydroxy-2-naphthoate octaprenyltransferase
MVSLHTRYFQSAKKLAAIWLIEIRPIFLLGSVVLAFLGTSIAWLDGFFSLGQALLSLFGLILWQISVQVLNDYYDYRSGIDLYTQRTRFSGGSGILPSRILKARSVFKLGLLSFVLALPIWSYLIIEKGMLLLPVIIVGGICVFLYTPVLTKWRLAEMATGLCLGLLPILMFYFVQTGSYTLGVIAPAIASGILMFEVHLLNELPDVEADEIGGRRTLPIILGIHKASRVYLYGTILFYIWVISWVAVGIMPQTTLLSLLTIPVNVLVLIAIKYGGNLKNYAPVLWAGAVSYYLSIALLALGYILSRL